MRDKDEIQKAIDLRWSAIHDSERRVGSNVSNKEYVAQQQAKQQGWYQEIDALEKEKAEHD